MQFLLLVTILAFQVSATEGFYKDLFMDGGEGLSIRTTLPAADSLHFLWERVSTSDKDTTLAILVGDSLDSNGVLLYPDGSPRFRMVYVNGGQSNSHGDTLGSIGRQRFIDFYYHGGSYSGSCAGAILATMAANTSRSDTINPNYFHIYPARSHYGQLAQSYTNMIVPSTSMLLSYYPEFATDSVIDSIRHNGGVYLIKDDKYWWASGTEILATYIGPVMPVDITRPDTVYQKMLGNVSTWAYKHNDTTGRMVLTGSHPEGVESGRRLHMFEGMLRYAIDGVGCPSLKGDLIDGETRVMGNNGLSGHERIGDRQYHHFRIEVPQLSDLTVKLEGESGYDFSLFMEQGDFAFLGGSSNYDHLTGSIKTITIKGTSGTWFIGVKCVTTVTATKKSWGYQYSGKTAVLNGVPYTVRADIDPITLMQKFVPEKVVRSQLNRKYFDLKGRLIPTKTKISGVYIVREGAGIYRKISQCFR